MFYYTNFKRITKNSILWAFIPFCFAFVLLHVTVYSFVKTNPYFSFSQLFLGLSVFVDVKRVIF
jgi:Ca2+/Na+ antiporter